MNAQQAVDAYLAEIGVKYMAVFVPQNASRNANDKQPTLNWRVTLTSANSRTLSTDYMQGIGHVPGYCYDRTTYEHRQLQNDQNNAATTGTYPAVSTGTYTMNAAGVKVKVWKPAEPSHYKYGNGCSIALRPLPKPSAADVICSLNLDSSVNDAACFEDWASEFSYDTDSRDAERIYMACKLVARDYCRLFTAAQRAHLADLLQDY